MLRRPVVERDERYPSRPEQVRDELRSPSGISAHPPTTPTRSMSSAEAARTGSAPDRRIGTTLVGRYRIDALVGKGGMGRVYRATQLPLNRPVGVKILSPHFQKKDEQFVRRFFLEAASAARLTHRNTITVFDYGKSEAGELFIAMEFLQGRPLSKILAEVGRFEPERALNVTMQICRSLREAHAKGIIHRDLKPGNILIVDEGDDGDFVKVLDFGLVKLFSPEDGTKVEPAEELTAPPLVTGEEGDLTRAGMFLGSPKYMSPEQIQGLPLDPRTDIYALGVLMFQMVAGRAPFLGATSVDVIYAHVNQPTPTFASVGATVPPELEWAIRRCLAKRREDRFASMNDLLTHLKDVQRVLTGHSSIDPSLSTEFYRVRQLRAGRERLDSLAPPLPEDSRAEGPSGTVDLRSTSSFLSTVGAWAAGVALAASLGTVAYLLARPAPTTAAASAAAQVVLKLVSRPPGAEVFHEGQRLGFTPTEASFNADQDGQRVERFTFRVPGYLDEIVDARIGVRNAEVRAVLMPEPKAAAVPVPDESAEPAPSYKENPY